MDDDDEIESWASIALGLIAWMFFAIGLVAVVQSHGLHRCLLR